MVESERAIAENDPQREAERREAVADATWDARAREIEAALELGPDAARDGSVGVVIVSYNTRELLERCLLSVEAQSGIRMHTIVVDNGSSDGSTDLVRDHFPEVQLIELGKNVGFGRANNIAFRHCTGDHVLLLNSDAFLAPARWPHFSRPRNATRAPGQSARGCTTSMAHLSVPRGRSPAHRGSCSRRWACIVRFAGWDSSRISEHGTMTRNAVSTSSSVLACCCGRKPWPKSSASTRTSGFTARRPISNGGSRHGWQVTSTPAALATHVGAASSGASVVRLRNFYGGQRRFLKKHGTPLAWPSARVALVIGSLLRRQWSRARVALERTTP